MSHDVPNDAGAVVRGRDSLSVILVNLYLVNTATVLLERALHDLSLARDSPHADLTLLTTGDDSLAVVSSDQRGDTVVMSVVDSVKQLTRLREESSNLAVGPT